MTVTNRQLAALYIEAVRLAREWTSDVFPPIRDENGPLITTGRSSIKALDEFCAFVSSLDCSYADLYKAADKADYWQRVPGYEETGKPEIAS